MTRSKARLLDLLDLYEEGGNIIAALRADRYIGECEFCGRHFRMKGTLSRHVRFCTKMPQRRTPRKRKVR